MANVTLQGVLAPNEAAPRGRVVRDLALVLVAGVLAVAAVAVDHADLAGGAASTAQPRLLAAGYALAAATVAVLSLWDRANRLPGVPAHSRNWPIEAARPTQMVRTSHRTYCIVS